MPRGLFLSRCPVQNTVAIPSKNLYDGFIKKTSLEGSVMKKLLALVFALCLFCTSVAFAESITSDGSMLELDDFSIQLMSGMVYTVLDRTPTAVMFKFLPYANLGDTASNINFVWDGAPFDISVEDTNALRDVRRQNMIEALEAAGYKVNSFVYGDAFDCPIGDEPGVALDSDMSITYMSQTFTVKQRQISIGSKGYVISLSATDTETLEYMTEMLRYMVYWK